MSDSDTWHTEAFRNALKQLEHDIPKNLIARAQPDAADRGAVLTAGDLTKVIERTSAPDPFLTALGLQVNRWDAQPSTEEWTNGTSPSTSERRTLICNLLGLDEAGCKELLAKRPIYVDPTVVITAPWERWYTTNRAAERSFYWPRYRDHLLHQRKWPEENVTALDLATTSIVERLADPTRSAAHQAKGLVVGYVQSGKTANFTGVVAKALDAGYRLIIVMTGTIELLRAQTQRRMDMELVGRQNILADLTPDQAAAAHVDYQDDPDWTDGKFLDLGDDPISTEINRLTTHDRDYQKQFKNLKIERFDKTKPLYNSTNLFATAARLVITKKNATVLKKLVTDLQANVKAFGEIPVLIIDDESDQASVNTIDPDKVKAAKAQGVDIAARRAINERIANMLTLMPRAQYVGYTATPFANVFVDPSDPEGIYPKDFVIGLQRPPGYMGVDNFHDLHNDLIDTPATPATSNRVAYVRDLLASEGDNDAAEREAELTTALDMFVLTGACKLYRAATTGHPDTRHHTMLIHESVKTKQHKDLADEVRRLWTAAGFSTIAGLNRLHALYDSDIIPVSSARIEPDSAPLPDFDALKPHISKAITLITEHDNNPVMVVNSDKEIQQQQLDFDRHQTWRVLIGGAKLSRGFTIEGLTVTYFRRATNMSDSLTQMGRWFGYRAGYRDLVRLYIDRDAKFGTKRVDLYKAFEAIAQDEAAFRDQLAKYADWDGDKPRILPSQIPPLVSQHLPWLRPTANNKMFNAVLSEQSDRMFNPSGYPNHVDPLHRNLGRWRPIIGDAASNTAFPAAGQTNLKAFTGVIDAGRLLEVLNELEWMYRYGEGFVQPRLNYLRRLLDEPTPRLAEFLLVLPQPDGHLADIAHVGSRRVVRRQRRNRGGDVTAMFGEISDPKHRAFVQPLLEPDKPAVHPLAELWGPQRGVVLVYLVHEDRPEFDSDPKPKLSDSHPERGLIVGFTLMPPAAAVGDDKTIRFTVVQGDDPTVAAVPAQT